MSYLKLMLKIFSIGLIIFLVNCFFYQICFVVGNSMNPTLYNKELIVIKKYNLNLKYNDIVVIKKNKKIVIKRIIGMPNDTIEITNYPYVNGEKFDDGYIKDKGNLFHVTLNDNEYFVLGDNRNESIDSRFEEIGVINKKDIIGKMIW